MVSGRGEFDQIERWGRILGEAKGIEIGIGDDAAVFAPTPGMDLAVTSDAMVEGVHFELAYTPLDALGWKALAINLSDLAAMAAVPRAALVNVALPPDKPAAYWDSMFEGLAQCAEAYACPVIGGDTVRSRHGIMLSVTAMGEVECGRAVTRNGANAGDLLCVSGPLGGSRTGLEVLSGGHAKETYPTSVEKFLRPKPKVSESRDLAAHSGITAMIDISDGLASEIGHLCRQSGLGCFVHAEKLPILDEAAHWANVSGVDSLEYALYSGEEYELLFTVPESAMDAHHLSDWIQDAAVIGRMMHEPSILLETEGRTRLMTARGWDHFS